MVECLISLVIITIVAVIVLMVVEAAVNSIGALPPPVWPLIRMLVALLILLYGLRCLRILV